MNIKLIEQTIATNNSKLMQHMIPFYQAEAKKREAFYQALANFQGDMHNIKKEGAVAFNKTQYTYAKFEDIVKSIRPHLNKYGLSFRFEQVNDQHRLTVSCIVAHEEGHFESTSMSGFPDQSGGKNQIQQIASTMSYLRRYTLTGALGLAVADEDDDGQQYQQQNNDAAMLDAMKKELSHLYKQLNTSNKNNRDVKRCVDEISTCTDLPHLQKIKEWFNALIDKQTSK